MTVPAGNAASTDRIEKQFEVSAKRSRVWRAIADATEFGSWFGMKLNGPFVAGTPVHGRLTVAGYEHLDVELLVESVEPERYFSYRWHPYAIDPKQDYSAEPTTLVEFRLEETSAGTSVTIVESGFDRLPASRRAEAYRMNDGGWAGQSRNLTAYVGQG
jgi:uncharacterized protein YndB with AHSA1/START domain